MDFPRFRRHPSSLCSRFQCKVVRAHMTEVALPADPAVETLDVVENIPLGPLELCSKMCSRPCLQKPIEYKNEGTDPPVPPVVSNYLQLLANSTASLCSDSKSRGRKAVRVRPPPPAPSFLFPNQKWWDGSRRLVRNRVLSDTSGSPPTRHTLAGHRTPVALFKNRRYLWIYNKKICYQQVLIIIHPENPGGNYMIISRREGGGSVRNYPIFLRRGNCQYDALMDKGRDGVP
jgi:hypothetical protein